ncbi:MAG: hypothetical protein KDA25_02545, partial [Phycisphaerales bacterium]|nr:hypothetical protein [Phycisphaerales bacterium]
MSRSFTNAPRLTTPARRRRGGLMLAALGAAGVTIAAHAFDHAAASPAPGDPRAELRELGETLKAAVFSGTLSEEDA